MPALRHWPHGSHCMLVQSQLHPASGRGKTSPTTNAATASVPLRAEHRGVTNEFSPTSTAQTRCVPLNPA